MVLLRDGFSRVLIGGIELKYVQPENMPDTSKPRNILKKLILLMFLYLTNITLQSKRKTMMRYLRLRLCLIRCSFYYHH